MGRILILLLAPAVTFRLALVVAAELAASPVGTGANGNGNGTTSNTTTNTSSDSNVPASFRPSIAVIVGVLTTMFSLTFLLLIYAKHCKRNNPGGVFGGGGAGSDELPMILPQVQQQQQLLFGRAHDAGIDPAVVEALPTFSFSSLKGNKDGLECAVCLSKYEDREILRLLPKCKHAFHIDCVDTWLASHSTCPLCRSRVTAEDLLAVDEMMLLMLSSRRRSLDQVPQVSRTSLDMDFGSSQGSSSFQIYIQREDDHDQQGSSCFLNAVAEEKETDSSSTSAAAAPARADAARSDHGSLRRVGHRIIVSDVVLQRRWSDLVPSDVLFLGSSQGLFCPSVEHVPSKQQQQQQQQQQHPSLLKRALSLGRNFDTGHISTTRSSSQRCMSELTGLERLHNSALFCKKETLLASSQRHQVDDREQDEDSGAAWKSIARRTLNWIMRRSRLESSSTTSSSFPLPHKHSSSSMTGSAAAVAV